MAKFQASKAYWCVSYYQLDIAPTKEEYIRSSYTYRAIRPNEAQFQKYMSEHISYYPSKEQLQELYSEFYKGYIEREQERYLKEHLDRVNEEDLKRPNIQSQYNITFGKDGIYETDREDIIEALRRLVALSNEGALGVQLEEIQ